jgi:hypothetical protein
MSNQAQPFAASRRPCLSGFPPYSVVMIAVRRLWYGATLLNTASAAKTPL